MERYAAYKDSGIDWIGEIPEHWSVCPIKYIASCNDETLPESTDPAFEFEYIDISSVTQGSVNCSEHQVFATSPSRARRRVRTDDVIVSTVRTYLRAVARIDASRSGMIVSTGFAVLRPRTVTAGFFAHCLQEDGFIATVERDSEGISYPAITAFDLVRIPIATPPLEEQGIITAFLDEATGRIDALTERTERSIELLSEYRKSAISEAVTKGLDPKAPLKESNFGPIGHIPSHWNTQNFKSLASIAANLQDPLNFPGIRQVAPEIIEKDTGRITESRTVEESGVTSDNHYFNGETILYSKVRPMLNKVAIVNFEGMSSADVYPVKTEMHLPWLRYCMLSNSFLQQVSVATIRVKMPKVNKEELSNFVIPVPPLEEQRAIADHLDALTARIDAQLESRRALVERLREYRRALISECVTGAIKVPGVK